MAILVTGGAGYIGSHMCKLLNRKGYELVVLDDLCTGHRQAAKWGQLEQVPLSDAQSLDRIFSRHSITAVIHFAGSIFVGDSVREPLAYYNNNVSGTLSLLTAMHKHGVRRFVFSSSAAVYGNPLRPVLDEAHPLVPLSPYGHSKLMIEQVLRDHAAAGAIDAVALRYFNAAGADPEGELGEAHDPEMHLIPLLLKCALGEVPQVLLHGDDYPTPDGTCVRDYIHINDLCEAHLLALDYMESGKRGFYAFNLGNGEGYSVRQVLDAVQAVTKREINARIGPRRAGDAASLVADSSLAQQQLGWKPSMPQLASIVESAWRWHCAPRF